VYPSTASEGDVKWLRFSKAFVQSHYAADAAVGEIVVIANGAQPAKNVHKLSCSGDDGELHIGILNESLSPSNAKAPSFPESSSDDAWGLVAELPNAALGDGPAQLADVVSKSITFHGYFRVWNEGHDHGPTPASNPHHVFEVHPAWKFRAQGTEFDEPSLVKAIPDYSGYGITKLRPLFTSLADGEWLTAYGDGDDVFVSLRDTSNFFQFPVIIRSVNETSAGHEGAMDIYTNTDYKNKLGTGVRFVTVTGSALDGKLVPGRRTSLLGLFSVNLSRILSAADSVHAESEAKSVPDALEFFVFGKPLNAAVKDSQCHAERDQ
jgi:hypothetical protein